MNENYEVDFESNNWEQNMFTILQKEGIVIINDVFGYDESDQLMEQTIESIKTLSPELNNITYTNEWKNLETDWVDKNLPIQTLPGMFQHLLANLPVVWKVRSDDRVRKINEVIHSKIRGKKITKFVSSIDGINICPSLNIRRLNRDWPHVDQTSKEEFGCIQGQVVLSDSSAGFRCSPRSHKIFDNIIDDYDINEKSNFYPFSEDDEFDLEQRVLAQGGEWQKVFRTRKGSMILWFSSTIHSATLPDPKFSYADYDNINPKWLGWRGVFYVCYRPSDDVDAKHKLNLRYNFYQNLTSNHRGDAAFTSRPLYIKKNTMTKKLYSYLGDPKSVFKEHPSLEPKPIPKIVNLLCGK